MSENQILSLIAGLMVLVLIGGGLARRGMPAGKSLRLLLIWLGIIVAATIAVTLLQPTLR
jgi:hypothetical protein